MSESGGGLLIDTSVLIDVLRGRAEAVAFLESAGRGRGPTTHAIVVAELLAGARDAREQATIDSFLSAFEVVCPDEADALRALALYRQLRLTHGVDWPDCQIAATALRRGLGVATQNVKHFAAFAGLRVARAY